MANKFKNKKDTFKEPRINSELKGDYDVRVVYPADINDRTKYTSEVMSLSRAKDLSDRFDMDLIEINPNIKPPIMRIDEYDKWLYKEKKKAKENKQKPTELKEIQLSTNIGKHDLEIKANKVKEFIGDGDKVKVVLTMKNRELTRREESKKCILELIIMVSDVAVPESMPKDVGNRCIVILKKKK